MCAGEYMYVCVLYLLVCTCLQDEEFVEVFKGSTSICLVPICLYKCLVCKAFLPSALIICLSYVPTIYHSFLMYVLQGTCYISYIIHFLTCMPF